jgi:hypothetical protein
MSEYLYTEDDIDRYSYTPDTMVAKKSPKAKTLMAIYRNFGFQYAYKIAESWGVNLYDLIGRGHRDEQKASK